MKVVKKLTNNVGGTDKGAVATATSDKLFLLSYSEIVPTSYWASSYSWTSSEGTQYEAFKGKVVNNSGSKLDLFTGAYWWERSVSPADSVNFLSIDIDGNLSHPGSASNSRNVFPAFCF
ncbi:MAG: DUF6273 domain-containing protein [Collinsella sp.]